MGGRRRARAIAAAVASLVVLTPVGGQGGPLDEAWRAHTVRSEPATREEPSHPGVMHEWWYFTVQSPEGSCGPWQTMVTFLSDKETAKDMLLFTAVVGDQTFDLSEEFLPGTLRSNTSDAGPGVGVWLEGSRAEGRLGVWSVEALSGGGRLTAYFEAEPAGTWRRAGPEGFGVLEITHVMRAKVTATLEIGETVCEGAGSGYYEHVWGNWSRLPMWGVDYLNVHLDDGWSAYARRTPMRGEGNFYPAVGVEPKQWWPEVLLVSDGTHIYQAQSFSIQMTESEETVEGLGIKSPASYRIVGRLFTAPTGGTPPLHFEVDVTEPRLATILLPETSSGILEGWGRAAGFVDAPANRLTGTAEIEMQRYGTRYPR